MSITKEEYSKQIQRDIITNPPYNIAKEFVMHALDISQEETKVAMFLKVQFLESVSRRELFDKYPPKYVYIPSRRFHCYKNGDTSKYVGNAMMFCWFVWVKWFYGEPRIRWIN